MIATEGSSCPYCGAPVAFHKSSAFLYGGRDYGPVFACSRHPGCDAYVSCHKSSGEALGRLADAELRAWRKRAHAAFDPRWEAQVAVRSKGAARREAYRWLARELGIPEGECHMSWFDVETCRRVVELCAPSIATHLVPPGERIAV